MKTWKVDISEEIGRRISKILNIKESSFIEIDRERVVCLGFYKGGLNLYNKYRDYYHLYDHPKVGEVKQLTPLNPKDESNNEELIAKISSFNPIVIVKEIGTINPSWEDKLLYKFGISSTKPKEEKIEKIEINNRPNEWFIEEICGRTKLIPIYQDNEDYLSLKEFIELSGRR